MFLRAAHERDAAEAAMAEVWQRKLAKGERWSESDGRAALAAWEASGDGLTAFARRHGFRPQRLAWWGDRVGWRSLDRAAPAFASVTVTSTAAEEIVARIVVGSTVVEVLDPARVSAEWVALLAAALSSPRAR